MSYNDQADDEVIFCLPRFDSDQISVHTNGRKSKCRSVGLFHWIRCLQYSSICGYHHHHSVPATYLIGSSWKLFLNGKCVSYILTSFVGRHIVSSTTYLPTYLPTTHTHHKHLSVVEILIAHEHGLDTNKQTNKNNNNNNDSSRANQFCQKGIFSTLYQHHHHHQQWLCVISNTVFISTI